jgi:hypothetical protein
MTAIDELAHRLEIEAEVLRAVSPLPASIACQLLLDLVIKIRRAADVPQAIVVSAHDARDREPDLQAAAPEKKSVRRQDVILAFVREHGEVSRGAIYAHVASALGEPTELSRNRTYQQIRHMVTKFELLDENGLISLRSPPALSVVGGSK